MTVRVRPVRPADKAAWLALFKGYIAFYGTSVSDDVLDTLWQRMMRGEPDCHIAVVAVDEEDQPIGLAHLLFHRSTWSKGWYCYLEDLFVDPARRKAGVGRALIEMVYAMADARGCERTYWVTQEFNATARALYDQVATRAPFVQYRR